jgi:outer membrane protein assembly factor BamD (BamD/ComL family)
MNATTLKIVSAFLCIGSFLVPHTTLFGGKNEPYRMAKKPQKTTAQEDKVISKLFQKRTREQEKLRLAKQQELKLLAEAKPLSRMKKRRYIAHRTRHEHKTYSTMTLQELAALRDKTLQAKVGYKNHNNRSDSNHILIIYTERMIKLSDDMTQIADLMIDLADLYCEQKEWDKAATLFKEFSQLYPGNDKTEYALYKGVECLFETVKDIDGERDQTKVKEAIDLAQKFLDRKIFTTHKSQVASLQTTCYEKLVDYELTIASYYLHKDSLVTAQKRLDYIRKELLAKATNTTPHLLQHEIALAQKKNDEHMLTAKRTELAQLLHINDLNNLPPLKKPTYFFAMKM